MLRFGLIGEDFQFAGLRPFVRWMNRGELNALDLTGRLLINGKPMTLRQAIQINRAAEVWVWRPNPEHRRQAEVFRALDILGLKNSFSSLKEAQQVFAACMFKFRVTIRKNGNEYSFDAHC